MVEHTEDYGDGFRYALKPVSPGENIVRKGDDVPPGKIVLKRSALISSKETGALAALGFTAVTVYQKPVAGILSTGDELVPVDEKPAGGQVRIAHRGPQPFESRRRELAAGHRRG